MCDSHCAACVKTPLSMELYCDSRRFVENKRAWLEGREQEVLVGFDCNANPIDDDALAFFKNANHSRLISIALRGRFSDKSVQMLARIIDASNSIESVLLWSDNMSNQAYAHIAHAIKHSKTLKYLSMRNQSTPIPVDEIRALFLQAVSAQCVRQWGSEWQFEDSTSSLRFEFANPGYRIVHDRCESQN